MPLWARTRPVLPKCRQNRPGSGPMLVHHDLHVFAKLLFKYTLFYKQLRSGVRAQLLSTTTRFEPSKLLKSCLIDIWKFSLCALIFK